MRRYIEGARTRWRVRPAARLSGVLLILGCGPSARVDRESRLPPDITTPTPLDAHASSSGLPDSAGPDATTQPELDVAPEAPPRESGPPDVTSRGVDAALPALPDAAASGDRSSALSPDLAAPDLGPEARPALDLAPPSSAAPSLEPSHADNDLSALGPADWAHWGHGDEQAINRKAGTAPRIRMALAGGGALAGFSDRTVRMSWSNGTPAAAASESGGGVATGGAPGRGFRLEVTGDPLRPSRVKIFLGLWRARAELVARVGDQPPLSPLVADAPAGSAERVYTLSFGPLPAGRPLVVLWSVTQLHHVYANVTLRAATLEDL